MLPIALLFKFRDISLPHGLQSLVEEFIFPQPTRVFRHGSKLLMDVVGSLSWVEDFDGCGGRPQLEDEEKITILVRDE